MLNWSLQFLIVAIVTAVFGYGGVDSGGAEIARVFFFFFTVAFAASLVWHPLSGRRSAPPL